MQVKLDDVTNRWGVKVTAVEIREIEPPPAISEAMTRQMSAERTRRAQITESEGTRDAQVNVAEGERQAAILQAEGEKRAAILQAEGHREAQVLEATGYAEALGLLNEAASTAHGNTMGPAIPRDDEDARRQQQHQVGHPYGADQRRPRHRRPPRHLRRQPARRRLTPRA